MDLRYLEEEPPEGTLAFNGELMVRFKEENSFYVYNGHWWGEYLGGNKVYILHTRETFGSNRFQEVVSLTEKEEWYVSGNQISLSDLM